MTPRNAEGPDTDARPCHCERQFHTTEGKAFVSERSATAGTPRRKPDLVPAGELLVPVLRELFARADVLDDGEAAVRANKQRPGDRGRGATGATRVRSAREQARGSLGCEH